MEDFFERCSPEPNSGCWIWLGATSKGYPCIRRRPSPTIRVHRLVLAEKLGRPIRSGFHALHICDVTLCINPAHLYEGSHSQNIQEAWDRGKLKARRKR